MLFDIVVIDPPYPFADKLRHNSVKRGAESQYKSVMSDKDILNLNIKSIMSDDALLCLWCPSAYLDLGLQCVKNYGFKPVGTWIWVKTKKKPLLNLSKQIFKSIKKITDFKSFKKQTTEIINSFNINEILSFYMGHYFRQTHEIVLVGVRGKMASKIKNKSQRSVFLGPIGKHSEKPEALQDMLELMFPLNDSQNPVKACELFARRNRENWVCRGNEVPGKHFGEDIRESIEQLKNE